MKLAQRTLALKPSPTLAMAAKAKELSAQGKDVVSLTVGEPDWSTYEPIVKSGIRAIEDGFTKYTVASGIPELKQLIAESVSKELATVSYQTKEVVVGTGAKYILFSALQMLVDPGDEVIIPAPYWVSYPTMVELAGGKNVYIETNEKDRFKMTAQQLEKAITTKTKLIILCSPSNPTGVMYTHQELKAISQVLLNYPNILVISDDIYNRLVFHNEKVAPHILHVAPELKERLLLVNGASKTYSMTGWRVGWGLGPAHLIQMMGDYISQSTSNACSISQRAVMAALKEGEPYLAKALVQLKGKCEMMQVELEKIQGIEVTRPDGAFYLWIKISSFFGKTHKLSGKKISNSKDFADVLLGQHHVATVPGIEFGSEGYLRLSFATSEKSLLAAIERFKNFSEACV